MFFFDTEVFVYLFFFFSFFLRNMTMEFKAKFGDKGA